MTGALQIQASSLSALVLHDIFEMKSAVEQVVVTSPFLVMPSFPLVACTLPQICRNRDRNRERIVPIVKLPCSPKTCPFLPSSDNKEL